MTFASKITVTRILMVPVFAVLAIYYGKSIEEGHPEEWLRWWALGIFITASASDGLDGWIARRFNQRSKFGATIDPIADKLLLLTGIITLSLVDWGENGWRIPLWFCALVIVRDFVILGGCAILHYTNHSLDIKPHWSGKVCTVTQMFALGWVMLRVVPFDPIYPCIVAAIFTLWSGYVYLRRGMRRLRDSPDTQPDSLI
ncbi:CDP-diacylglycerol--glycerol-3-phosphate 3-phosphatidyltransferase [Haloferula chungangensis]|uniref:CDP-diacylglycerol--glycerol-3-phosphate 3-phosphatidyltransferase n=1 Tax=Haloferula chungangensis TaxID=1048331 RepID=A0ABW2L325_9BACT